METRIDRFGSVRDDKIKQLKQLIEESNNIVFLGGAGVSTESGIPDFRSGAGIYNTESGTKYRPIDIIAHDFSSNILKISMISISVSSYILMQDLTRLTRLSSDLRDRASLRL